MTNDATTLDRFVRAQENTFDNALAEIRRGAKRGHWMWYIFPQLRGLGHSEMARHFGIASLDEAKAYLVHPLLGSRLRESVDALGKLSNPSATTVFGEIDAMKLRSSLTLFARAGRGPTFGAELIRWCGSEDPRTLELLKEAQ